MKISVKNKNLKLRNIKLLILDIDGVMTDGGMVFDNSGNEYKVFNVHDGYGIELIKRAGVRVAIVTGKNTNIVKNRAEELGITDLYQGINNKSSVLDELLSKYGVSRTEVCAVGDDLYDIDLLEKTGFPVAVKNARPEVKKIAAYVTKAHGGRGAVREITELILKAKKC